MNRQILFILSIGVFLCCLVPLFSEDSEIVQDEQESSFQIFPIPIIGYTPDMGLFGGAAAFVAIDTDIYDSKNRSQYFGSNFIYTEKNQVLLGFGGENWFYDDTVHLTTEFSYRDFPTALHKLGNDSPKETENYDLNAFQGTVRGGVRVLESLYAGVLYGFNWYDTGDWSSNNYLNDERIVGAEGGWVSSPGVYLQYDSTDGKAAPLKGIKAYSEIIGSGPVTGSEFSFGVLENGVSIYQPIIDEHVIAAQVKSSHAFGTSPFNYLPELGGSEVLRGFPEGRFKDNHSFISQLEYRSPYIWRFAFAVFGGTGRVAETVQGLFDGDYHFFAGLGLRFAIDLESRLNLRVDVAFTKEQVGFYINAGEAF